MRTRFAEQPVSRVPGREVRIAGYVGFDPRNIETIGAGQSRSKDLAPADDERFGVSGCQVKGGVQAGCDEHAGRRLIVALAL